MLYKQFYSELGKLLYAVADIDGITTPREKKILHDIVRKELIPAEKHVDEFGTNTAMYAEIEFEFLQDEDADAESAFESFVNFVEDHHSAFDKKMRSICLKVASKLANEYQGTVKKTELVQRLRHTFEKMEPQTH
jgi:hypothetical protein